MFYEHFGKDSQTDSVVAQINSWIGRFRTFYVNLCAKRLATSLEKFEDVMISLRTKPRELLACMGIALSAKFLYADILSQHENRNPFEQVGRPRACLVRACVSNLYPESGFGEVRASTVNQLLSLRGR